MSLSDIQTIVIVIMENRSFDHMLGYLSLDGIKPVEGLKGDAAWQASFANAYDGKSYPLFRIEPGAEPCSDPQHDQRSIACQINTPAYCVRHTAESGLRFHRFPNSRTRSHHCAARS